jgi:hypothetical protein
MKPAPRNRGQREASPGYSQMLAAYLVAGGALAGLPEDAQATVIYTNRPDITIGPGSSYALDIDSNGLVDFTINNDARMDKGSAPPEPDGMIFLDVMTQGTNRVAVGPCPPQGCLKAPYPQHQWAQAYPPKAQIGPDLTWASGWMGADTSGQPLPTLLMAYWSGNHEDYKGIPLWYETDLRGYWLGANHAYLGLDFDIAGHTHYGWLGASVIDGYPLTATLHDWAYEDVPGMPIIAGAVPPPPPPPEPVAEPSALGLLALGFSVVLALACRRQADHLQDSEST